MFSRAEPKWNWWRVCRFWNGLPTTTRRLAPRWRSSRTSLKKDHSSLEVLVASEVCLPSECWPWIASYWSYWIFFRLFTLQDRLAKPTRRGCVRRRRVWPGRLLISWLELRKDNQLNKDSNHHNFCISIGNHRLSTTRIHPPWFSLRSSSRLN